MNGTIKRLVRDRGFGFIRGEDGFERFFHKSGCVGGTHFDDLNEGHPVTFEDEKSSKGPRAGDVSLVRG